MNEAIRIDRMGTNGDECTCDRDWCDERGIFKEICFEDDDEFEDGGGTQGGFPLPCLARNARSVVRILRDLEKKQSKIAKEDDDH